MEGKKQKAASQKRIKIVSVGSEDKMESKKQKTASQKRIKIVSVGSEDKMEGKKQKTASQKPIKIVSVGPEDKEKLLEEPRLKVQPMIDKHEAARLTALQSELRL